MNDSKSPSSVVSGLIALHGNRVETLLETVAAWVVRNPLGVLETETLLVQSNGMAEWVKMALARQAGVCAAVSVQLPARFQWQVIRQVLGRARVPARSPLDKTPLAWRLMRLLGGEMADPAYAPLTGYLGAGDAARRFQLATRIADLYDQYQIYRPDWLEAWSEGEEVLVDPTGDKRPLTAEQRWQARLWRRIVDELPPDELAVSRARVLDEVIAQLESADTRTSGATSLRAALPRRIVLFGVTNVPLPTLRLLAALSRHSQVILAIPNPCRFHWADIMDGRELLDLARRRLPLRNGQELRAIGLEAMHLHAHPLLAAWGRQSRDFVRQLDAFDDAEASRQHFQLDRIDLFDEESAADASLLAQVQDHIRDLLPLNEHPRPPIAAEDRSIVFHTAHSAVRELEVLHDELLALLAAPPGGKALNPRDIVVMVPSIDDFAPAIRAVFGQYGRGDPRHIPFDIADLSARTSNPLMGAIEWLLRLPRDRCRLSDLCALLEVPAVAARFDIEADQVPRLAQWMSGAGIRWGLDATHRSGLELGACGEQNSALFGLRRMLMGFAVGRSEHHLDSPFAGIEPYDEVGGLEATLAGAFARLLEQLLQWERTCLEPASPDVWVAHLRALFGALLHATDDSDRATLAALDDALTTWLDACEEARYEDELPIEVVGEALLSALDLPRLGKRFRAGGVTFCTLMPMRAIPFEVVCLLGMNEGDYPRRSPRSDFDLMGLPGQQRPGDRARRDDDRQLMLEALLSARRVLYVSWCGRSVRDNSEQPPSVLVSQLSDYLAAGWSPAVVAQRTTHHPLQPFSRRYFEAGSPLRTFAREWRSAHEGEIAPGDAAAGQLEPLATDSVVALSIGQLASFLKNPVKVFFRQRLGVVFDDARAALPDDETFALDALEEHGVVEEVAEAVLAELAELEPAQREGFSLQASVSRRLGRLERAGELPLGAMAARTRTVLDDALTPLIDAWRQVRADRPFDAQRLPLRFEHAGTVIEDWLDHRVATEASAVEPLWLSWTAGRLREKPKKKEAPPLRAHKLLVFWVRSLLAAASSAPGGGVVIARDCTLQISAMDAEAAQQTLAVLLEGWQSGMRTPLPVAAETAIAFVKKDREAAADTYDGDEYRLAESQDPSLRRCYPDFDALCDDGRFEQLANTLYAPLLAWIEAHVSVTAHPEPRKTADEATR